MWPFTTSNKVTPEVIPDSKTAPVAKQAPIAPQEDPITRIINTVNNLPPASKMKMNQAIATLQKTFGSTTNKPDARKPQQEREKY